MAEINKVILSQSEFETLAGLCDNLLTVYDLENSFEIVEDSFF